jgi:hypothetical protein
VGIVGGVAALSSKSTLDEHCQGAICDHDGKTAADSAKSSALVSTIGFAVGAVGLASGVLLLLTRPRARSAAALVTTPLVGIDPHGATLGAKGVF